MKCEKHIDNYHLHNTSRTESGDPHPANYRGCPEFQKPRRTYARAGASQNTTPSPSTVPLPNPNCELFLKRPNTPHTVGQAWPAIAQNRHRSRRKNQRCKLHSQLQSTKGNSENSVVQFYLPSPLTRSYVHTKTTKKTGGKGYPGYFVKKNVKVKAALSFSPLMYPLTPSCLTDARSFISPV